MTIKRKLLGLTATGLAFVLAISVTGYWGISTVEQTTAEVAATGSAIRNHVEAGVYNDMTRSDISAVFTAKGDTRKSKLDDLAQHSRLLKDRIAKTEALLSDPTMRARLAGESRMIDQYVSAGESLAAAIGPVVASPPGADARTHRPQHARGDPGGAGQVPDRIC